MKKIYLYLALMPVVICSVIAAQPPRQQPRQPKPAEAKNVLPLKVAVGVAQKVVADYQNADKNPPMLLDKVDFDFKVQTEHSEQLGVLAYVVTLGGSHTDTEVVDATFSYAVPTPVPTKELKKFEALNLEALGTVSPESLSNFAVDALANNLARDTITPRLNVDKLHDKLLESMRSAAEAVKQAPQVAKANFKSFATTISYQVKWDGYIGANIPVFSFVTIGPKIDINRTDVHSIKLTFAAPTPTPTPTPSPIVTPSPSGH